MSVFSKIMHAIFSPSAAQASPGSGAPTAPSPGAPAAPSPGAQATPPAAAPAAKPGQTAATSAAPASADRSAAPQPVDVAAVLMSLAAKKKEKLDWRHSIVDLMKLLDLDSSLAARKELAHELKYGGDTNDSATMNVWLHKQVMIKLAEHGGKVPDELKHA